MIRVLIVEDCESDAKLVVHELERAGHQVIWTRVETRVQARDALASQTWDVVVSDWSLPCFDGLGALQVLVEAKLDVPFIIVTGTIDEATAVDAMRAGARDVIVKSRMARLAPAVERELHEREARRSRQEALQLSEAKFARLAESGVIGIALADIEGNVHDANRAYCELLGYSLDEIRQDQINWVTLTPPEWRPRDAEAVSQLAATGVARPWEKEMIHKAGHRVPLLIGVAMLDDRNCIAFTTDLTERKRAEATLRRTEDQLRQAQKLEAIGSLAGGIAHDFNNLLSVIISYASLALEELRAEDPMHADMNEVAKAAKRAAQLTRQLLAFSKRQLLQPKVVDLDQVLGEMASMLRRLIGEDVELVLQLASGTSRIMIDPTQLEQVVMNLVINARDAMPLGGSLTIETAEVVLHQRDADEHAGLRPGPHVMLAVIDSGEGMDAATMARIFEPFFTTKCKGTGLGLSTVFGIVQQSGGSISVDSEPGVGTIFRLYFSPVVGTPDAITERPSGPLPRGTETILLVEDDEALRQLTRTLLMRQGYRVLEAHNGGDALMIAEQHPQPIHLLLTDVVMPRISGRQLAERLLALRPEMRVLYMSGYTDDAILRHGVLGAEVALLQKPVAPASLLLEVRKVLDHQQRSR
jgi:hypothetical protein